MADTPVKEIIMVVDDFPDNAETVAAVLQSEIDCDTIVAKTGSEALALAESNPPDLILLDVMMPGMDGYEVCARLKQHEKLKGIPVIFLTARTDREDYLQGFHVGGVDYISKPFDINILLARVKAHLELKHQRDWMEKVSHQYQELIRMMCHDLINPIGSLKNILEWGMEDPDLMEDFKSDIFNLVNLCLEMIDQVGTVRKLEEGRRIALGPVQLSELIAEALFLARTKLTSKEIEVESHVDDQLLVFGERVGLLNSILGNLISNAIKFSKPRSMIHIDAYKNEGKVIFSIRDSGIGIPKEMISDLFDLTKTTSRPGTQGEMGAGYGMPIMKRYLDLFRAEIEIDSRTAKDDPDNTGVTVILKFEPAALPELSEEDSKEAAKLL